MIRKLRICWNPRDVFEENESLRALIFCAKLALALAIATLIFEIVRLV